MLVNYSTIQEYACYIRAVSNNSLVRVTFVRLVILANFFDQWVINPIVLPYS